jgi:predicted tellurium resistance membrane protein TerC
MIGFVLVLDGSGHHIQKGYIYFAMAFSLVVEMLNLRAGRKSRANSNHGGE